MATFGHKVFLPLNAIIINVHIKAANSNSGHCPVTDHIFYLLISEYSLSFAS